MVTCVPLRVTWLLSVTLTVRVSAPLLMTMLPVPTATLSLKVRTMLLPTATAVLLSAGLAELKVGAAASTTTALVPAALALPAMSVATALTVVLAASAGTSALLKLVLQLPPGAATVLLTAPQLTATLEPVSAVPDTVTPAAFSAALTMLSVATALITGAMGGVVSAGGLPVLGSYRAKASQLTVIRLPSMSSRLAPTTASLKAALGAVAKLTVMVPIKAPDVAKVPPTVVLDENAEIPAPAEELKPLTAAAV